MGRKSRKSAPAPVADPVPEAKIWRTKDNQPLPSPGDLVPGSALESVHGAALQLDGSFRSWLCDVASEATIEASIDALLVRLPSTTFAWLGSRTVINDFPAPRPIGAPPTAIPPPYTPERPFP